MFLKNYTSNVPVSKTISRIEELLSQNGAKAIGKNYENGKLTAITFQMTSGQTDFLVRLPANPDAVYEIMQEQCRRPRAGTYEKIREQAERTAWKIQQDWLEIELTQIQLRQKELLQVFMPYVWLGNQTFFQMVKSTGYRALLPAPKE